MTHLKSIKRSFICLFVFSVTFIQGQEINPNWADASLGATAEASSFNANPPWAYKPSKILDKYLQVRWETLNEAEGAWVKVNFNNNRLINEIWILSKSKPFDIILDPYLRTGTFQLAQDVTLTFSDGSNFNTRLQPTDNFQIIKLPKATRTNYVKVTINTLWPNSGKGGTGLAKIRAYTEVHNLGLTLQTHEMYHVIDNKPVKSVKIELVNPNEQINNANLVVKCNKKTIDNIQLDKIDANSVFIKPVWLLSPYVDSEYEVSLFSGKTQLTQPTKLIVSAYKKTYFESGVFNIHSTNHNDLGWLATQYETADYRSTDLILPALDIMKTDTTFTYTMECIEYLKEFLVRHPERKNEMVLRMRQKRFTFAASYVQVLQSHVGPEKLARQFYFGRRWFLDNFPGLDTRIYMNTDVPQLTWQLPQILKSAGINYLLQGRIPLGYFNWQGLDGTIIPTYGLRYADPYQVMTPKSGEGWIKYMQYQEQKYITQNLPKVFNYDYNADYIPPCNLLPAFVNEQNLGMKLFAADWNRHYITTDKQIQPPLIKFVNPEDMLNQVFNDPNINIETKKGEWPLSWAYYDEPSNREALLMGRKAHNALLSAEKLFAALNNINPAINYPQTLLDSAWRTTCWPEHGWGGNKGVQTDSIYHDHYKRAFEMSQTLLQASMHALGTFVPVRNKNSITLFVYNSLNHLRTDVVNVKVKIPVDWKGFEIKDANNNFVPFEIVNTNNTNIEIVFVAQNVPSVGYSSFYVESAKTLNNGIVPLTGDTIGNTDIKIEFGKWGIKQYTAKKQNATFFRTSKFEAGEILQFGAPGNAWDDWEHFENVTMDGFERSSDNQAKVIRFVETPVRYIREVETKFKNFTNVTRYYVYKHSNDIEIETDIIDWNGTRNRELRIAFPFNIDQKLVSYEIPFGTVDYMKDEVDNSLWRFNFESQYDQYISGGKAQIPFREALNWTNVSSTIVRNPSQAFGCLLASDVTMHCFDDQTANPVNYPVMQHVLLSTRRSLAWNPDYWYEQKGTHRYKMALYFHQGNWRLKYLKGLAFNYQLVVGVAGNANKTGELGYQHSFMSVTPSNIITTAIKQSASGNSTIIRFHEAEGKKCVATIKAPKPFKEAFITNLIELEPKPIKILPDGSLIIDVKPWEIITLEVKY